MELLNIASIGFFVVFLGTLFLFGELLVKVKGIFGIVGIGIMCVYFSYHVSIDIGLWVVLLYIIGLALIIIDGKVITDGTVALLGIVLMILGLAIPSPSILYGILASMGFILGGVSASLFLRIFPPRNIWSKMTLKNRLTSEHGYNSINETYVSLLGKQGKTLTPFRPIGNVEIDGEQYSATSGAHWIDKGIVVEVVAVDGTKIVVKKLPDESPTA